MFPIQCEESRINHLNPKPCSDNTLCLLTLVPSKLYWGLQVTSSFSIWGCHFEGRVWERYILKGQITFEGHRRRQSGTLVTQHCKCTYYISRQCKEDEYMACHATRLGASLECETLPFRAPPSLLHVGNSRLQHGIHRTLEPWMESFLFLAWLAFRLQSLPCPYYSFLRGPLASVQDWSSHMSLILKGSQIPVVRLKGWFESKTSIQEFRNEIQNSNQTCAWITCSWITWYMFSVQCGEWRINHMTPFLVVTMPYACWFLWRADYIEDFKWRLHCQFGVAFGRVVLREVYFKGPSRVWRAMKTSIVNTTPRGLRGLTRMEDSVGK